EDRLNRTKLFYLNLKTERVRRALVPEQWLRLVRDGKDIGYLYVTEEETVYGGSEGVAVTIRSRSVPDEGMQADAGATMFYSYDRRRERWVSGVIVQNAKGNPTDFSEVGTAESRTRRVAEEAPGLLEDPAARGNPQIRM